mmetsp:Transcript_14781/g.29925  ORF Transcript_14781/g.29925 Transcript_14781/m.29925 type:complete len:448 (-) Transcript_14781:286-1629(-)
MPQHDQLTTLSKALSTLLRHKAITDGVPITSDGWVAVSDAIQWVSRRHRGFTEEDVARVVTNNDKQRFSLRTRDHRAEIRANQGHSMTEITIDMTELSLATAPQLAVHGTYQRAWDTIRTMGLSKMNRQHVHMARDLPGESGVISGMRASCQVLVYVDLHAGIKAGMRFFESANGVILTDGFGGVVPPRFLARAVDRRTGRPLAIPEAGGDAVAALAAPPAAASPREEDAGAKRQRQPKKGAAKEEAEAEEAETATEGSHRRVQHDIHFYHRHEPYYEFTNFAAYEIVVDGKRYPTSEHYFQAQKYPNAPQLADQVRCAATPRDAFNLTRRADFVCQQDSGWAAVKDDVMLRALRAKFDQHPRLARRLLETGTRRLVEHTSNDSYWGDGGDGRGRNMLGQLLERVRAELRQSAAKSAAKSAAQGGAATERRYDADGRSYTRVCSSGL